MYASTRNVGTFRPSRKKLRNNEDSLPNVIKIQPFVKFHSRSYLSAARHATFQRIRVNRLSVFCRTSLRVDVRSIDGGSSTIPMAVYNPLTTNFHVQGTRRKFNVARTTRYGVLREFKIPLTMLLRSRTRAADRKGKEDDTRPTDRHRHACTRVYVEEETYFNREEENVGHWRLVIRSPPLEL